MLMSYRRSMGTATVSWVSGYTGGSRPGCRGCPREAEAAGRMNGRKDGRQISEKTLDEFS
jgi:hypothetical protein